MLNSMTKNKFYQIKTNFNGRKICYQTQVANVIQLPNLAIEPLKNKKLQKLQLIRQYQVIPLESTQERGF